MKKVVIAGAGIAGLSAGIFLSRAGFETVILEKNAVAGGLCSSWKRGPYTVDNCIHWLGGSREGSGSFNRAWHEVGVLTPEQKPVERDMFYATVLDGQKITLWRDSARTKEEMLALAPEDREEIGIFFDNVELIAFILNGKGTGLKTYTRGRNLLRLIAEKSKICRQDLRHYAERFRSPLLRQLILDFTAPEYEAYWLFLSYGMFVIGDADLPPRGSGGIIEDMLRTYTLAGGTVRRESRVVSLVRTRGKATGVVLENGETLACDYAILTCDLHQAYNIIDRRMPRKLGRAYREKLTTSSFQAAFAVTSPTPQIDDTVIIPCEPFVCGTRTADRLWIKNYRGYGDFIAPEGQTVLQISVAQYPPDYLYWKEIYGTEGYRQEKAEIARMATERIEAYLQCPAGTVRPLDCWTPATYAARYGCFEGAYMRFLTGLFSRAAFIPSKVRAFSNLYLAGAWLTYPGGCPTALLSGKTAAKRICKREHIRL